MSTALVVIGHPDQGSFVHALASRATRCLEQQGVTVDVHDLYAESFEAVAPPRRARPACGADSRTLLSMEDETVLSHQRALAAADYLVVAHPNWWGKPPAIVAGWLDRVLVPGVAYTLPSRQGLPTSLLHLQGVLVLNTGDTDPEREAALFGDPLEAIWCRCVGAYLGDVVVERHLCTPIAGSTPQTRDRWLANVDSAVEDMVRRSGRR